MVLEILSVFTLYFNPGSIKGNGLGVFTAYEKSKSEPEIHDLIHYLAHWVAGVKLIFIALLGVILWTGTPTTLQLSVVALILSISTFFWKMYPAIKKMDAANAITPEGYSKTLGYIIAGFLAVFIIALICSF